MNEEIKCFDPDCDPEDICRFGGAHIWIEFYNSSLVQVLRCKKCGRDSVGYKFNPEDSRMLNPEDSRMLNPDEEAR
jgi:hypothetical protein